MAFPPVPPHHSPRPFTFSRYQHLYERRLRRENEQLNGRGRGKSVFRKKSYYGVFQMQCILNPVKEYEKQLKNWASENCSTIEKTINRDNAILSQYDAEIAETELRIQDLKDRLARLDDVRTQLDGVLSMTEGAN